MLTPVAFCVFLFYIFPLYPVTLAHSISQGFCFHYFREKGWHSTMAENKEIDSFSVAKSCKDEYEVSTGFDKVPSGARGSQQASGGWQKGVRGRGWGSLRGAPNLHPPPGRGVDKGNPQVELGTMRAGGIAPPCPGRADGGRADARVETSAWCAPARD